MKPTTTWLLSQYEAPARAIAVAGSYHRVLGSGSKDSETVLEDLRRYCHIIGTTAYAPPNGPIDQVQMNINEGRRQAYMHMINMLGITEADLKTEEKIDGRSARRSPDGPEPKSRYDPSDPTLDGTPGGSGGNTAGDPSDPAGES